MTARCPELHEASVQALISIDGLPHNSVFLWTRRRRPLAHRNVRTAIRRFAADDRSASARTPIACTGAVLLAARCGARLRHRGRSHRRRRRRAPRTAHVSSLQASGSRRWPLVGSGATTRSPNSPGTALSGCRVRFAAPGLPEGFAALGSIPVRRGRADYCCEHRTGELVPLGIQPRRHPDRPRARPLSDSPSNSPRADVAAMTVPRSRSCTAAFQSR
jgi:hypothetical protein